MRISQIHFRQFNFSINEIPNINRIFFLLLNLSLKMTKIFIIKIIPQQIKHFFLSFFLLLLIFIVWLLIFQILREFLTKKHFRRSLSYKNNIRFFLKLFRSHFLNFFSQRIYNFIVQIFNFFFVSLNSLRIFIIK